MLFAGCLLANGHANAVHGVRRTTSLRAFETDGKRDTYSLCDNK